MAAPSRLLDLHEEGLELGSERVRIHARRRQEVRERTDMARVAGVAPVDREADLPHRLTVHLHRTEPFRDHRGARDVPAGARDLDLAAVPDAELLRIGLG